MARTRYEATSATEASLSTNGGLTTPGRDAFWKVWILMGAGKRYSDHDTLTSPSGKDSRDSVCWEEQNMVRRATDQVCVARLSDAVSFSLYVGWRWLLFTV